MQHLVTLMHNDRVATVVVDIPDGYDYAKDIHLPSCTGHFTNLKLLCQEQVPSGFHEAFWMLRPAQLEHTNVIAISKLQ